MRFEAQREHSAWLGTLRYVQSVYRTVLALSDGGPTVIRVGHIFDWPVPVCGHRRWAHLWSDTGDRQELDAFAARLGLKAAWLQIDTEAKRVPELRYHYDIVPTKHRLAVQMGAALTDELEYWREKAKGGSLSHC